MKGEKAIVVPAETPFTKCLNEFLKRGTAVFVEKDGKIIGLIDDRNFKKRTLQENMKSEKVCVACPILSKNNTIKEILDAFLMGHFKALPLVDDGEIYEITRTDVLEELLKIPELLSIPVKSIMRSPIITVDVHSKIKDVKKLMKEAGIHHVVVLDKNKVIGTFTTFDLLGIMFRRDIRQGFQLIRENKSLDEEPILPYIREHFIPVSPDASLKDAMEKMIEHKTSSLVVMEYGKAIGMLSARDVFREARKLFGRKWGVRISGLSEDTLFYYPLIKDKLRKVISKFEKSLKIGEGHLHIKEGKSVYELRLHILINNTPFIFKTEDYDLEDAVAGLCEQMSRTMQKEKSKKGG